MNRDLYGNRELTKRELKIVELVTRGMKNPEIARRLHTTDNVIKNWMRRIFDKTGMSTRLEVAIWYLKGTTRK